MAELNLVFWNVEGMSASDKKTRGKADRIIEYLFAESPDLIGLSEVSNRGLDYLKARAREHGYEMNSRPVDDLRQHCVLLAQLGSDVQIADDRGLASSAYAVWRGLTETGNPCVNSEVLHAPCIWDPGDIEPIALTVASVYTGDLYSHVAEQVQEAADKSTGGAVVAGGDWNISRMLDGDLADLGLAAFDALAERFGWTNVLPGPDGTEVPTWPVGRGCFPTPARQLDHLFTRLPDPVTASCEVVIPPDGERRLSDHALLKATLAA